MSHISSPNAVYEALHKVIDLPDGNVVSLTLRLEVEKAPVVVIERHVSLVHEVDVTALDSAARTHAAATEYTTKTTRYHLVEISE